MRDIRTRESKAGSVRTIDRASMLGDRMKQASIKGKEQIRGFDQSNSQNETAYAEERTQALFEEAAYGAGNAAGYGIRRGENLPIWQIPRKKLANLASPKGKPANLASSTCLFGKFRGRKREYADPSLVVKKEKAEAVLKKQYQIRKARDSARRKTERGGKRILASLRRVIRDSRFITGLLTVAGSIALIAIIVCTFFGSAFYILGDETNSGFTPGDFFGTGSTDIVEVAASQVGNEGGEPYWSWYGFNGRVEWCACFVSWCADKCGYIEAGIIPKFAVVGTGMDWFQNRGQWQGRGYHPMPGDIIFFDWDGDGYGNHVGIVESSDDRYVYTIEGNSSDQCRRRTYFNTSSMIMGYGIPAYPVAEPTELADKLPKPDTNTILQYGNLQKTVTKEDYIILVKRK